MPVQGLNQLREGLIDARVQSLQTQVDLETYVEQMGVSREAACNRALQLERSLRMQLPPWPVTVYASSHRRKGGAAMQYG